MSIYEKHNNFTVTTLIGMKKEDLADYCLVMQRNLINMKKTMDLQIENSKQYISNLEEKLLELQLEKSERLGD